MLRSARSRRGAGFGRMPWPFALGALLAFLIGTLAPSARAATADGIHKIQHVVVIMQENRSFDSYFGTFPGADGIPMQNGVPTVCVPDPALGTCVKPYHDGANRSAGGPHQHNDALADIDGGKMDGFIGTARRGRSAACGVDIHAPACSLSPQVPDVVGYHDSREIPNYWSWARSYVLQDHLFESDTSWSLPAHLFLVSGWSAKCSEVGNPLSCEAAVE